MASGGLEKIAEFAVEGTKEAKTSEYPWYTNLLDLADVAVVKDKPMGLLMHETDEDAHRLVDFVKKEFPRLGIKQLGKDVLVSYDPTRIEELSYRWSAPWREHDHYRIGELLGYPESARKAFASPDYNIYHVLMMDGFVKGKKFDVATCFLPFMPSSLGVETEQAFGAARGRTYRIIFGRDEAMRYVELYNSSVVDFKSLLGEWTDVYELL